MALTVLLPQDSANNPYLGLWDVANARWALWRGTNGALDGPGSAARADLATALYGPDGNPLLPIAAAIGDTDANPTTTSIASRATGWNGAAWERLKSGGGQLQVRLADIAGNGLVSIPASADGMNLGGDDSLLTTAAGMAFNGSTWDRVYNNTQGTLLASAARTASVSSAQQTNFNARGLALFLNVTAASGTGGIQLVLQAIDPVSAVAYQVNPTWAFVTTVGATLYIAYPGIVATTLQFSAALPRQWAIYARAGDSSSYTYSLGYALIN